MNNFNTRYIPRKRGLPRFDETRPFHLPHTEHSSPSTRETDVITWTVIGDGHGCVWTRLFIRSVQIMAVDRSPCLRHFRIFYLWKIVFLFFYHYEWSAFLFWSRSRHTRTRRATCLPTTSPYIIITDNYNMIPVYNREWRHWLGKSRDKSVMIGYVIRLTVRQWLHRSVYMGETVPFFCEIEFMFCDWKSFFNSRSDIVDDCRVGRPFTSITTDNIERVNEILQTIRWVIEMLETPGFVCWVHEK